MGFLRRLFGGGEAVEPPASADSGDAPGTVAEDRQQVSVWVRLGDPTFESEREQLRVFAFEDGLMRALEAGDAGEHDTNDLEAGFLAIRLLGDDADRIVEVIEPLLVDLPRGSYLAVRRGPTGTSEERLEIDEA
jgi:hypothetical protein